MQKNAEGGLSASYNIGARYFIREILKHLTGNRKGHLLEAKVPCSQRVRTSCVYADVEKDCDMLQEMELADESSDKHSA
ncbi:MAG: hypothetical protein ACLUI5_16615 [Fusicatenibacter saccharivorans]